MIYPGVLDLTHSVAPIASTVNRENVLKTFRNRLPPSFNICRRRISRFDGRWSIILKLKRALARLAMVILSCGRGRGLGTRLHVHDVLHSILEEEKQKACGRAIVAIYKFLNTPTNWSDPACSNASEFVTCYSLAGQASPFLS